MAYASVHNEFAAVRRLSEGRRRQNIDQLLLRPLLATWLDGICG